MEVAVRKRMLRLDSRYVPDRGARRGYFGDVGIGVNNAVRNRMAQLQVTAPQSGLVYRPGCQVRIVVSRTVFSQSANMLLRLEGDARTYSVPETVLSIQRDALESGDVLASIRLNGKMKNIDRDLLYRSLVRRVILTTEMNNMS